tara:strand:- start:1645 stop:2052 length:408 start_codon:yes stop_codon:yes gene_type:complete
VFAVSVKYKKIEKRISFLFLRMSATHKIITIPDYQDINILVNSEMNIKDAIDKSVPHQERIEKIGYHNLDILSRIMNHHDDKSSFAVYTSYMDKNKIGSNLFNFKKIKGFMYYDNEDDTNKKMYDKVFNLTPKNF